MSVSLYLLDASDENSFVDFGDGNDWEGIVCPVDPGHQRAGRRITRLKLRIRRKRIVDFSSTFLGDIVITDRVLQCFRGAGFTGYRVEPAEVVNFPKAWDRAKTPTLWELIVVGTASHAHPDSGIRVLRRCEVCGSTQYSSFEHGIIVDDGQWDGSDFVTVIEKPKHYLVTERVKRTVLESEFTNAEFTPSGLLE